MSFVVVALVVREAEDDALGLNGIPNRSARAFIACCSGVSSEVPFVVVAGADVDVELVAGAFAVVGFGVVVADGVVVGFRSSVYEIDTENANTIPSWRCS